jgi:3-deoxy-D-manno-octulosonic-acid transferase
VSIPLILLKNHLAMTILYYLAMRIFYGSVGLFSFFNHKAQLFYRGRKGLFSRLKQTISEEDRIFWFHCASLGEFEQGRPLIEAIKMKYPEVKILLTFFSPSGYEIRKNYEIADVVTYLPVDGPRNARKFLEIVQPEKVFFIKYEYWYFILREINKRNIPLYLVSAIFRRNQLFFRFYGKWFKRILYFFDHIFVQDQGSRELLESHKIKHVTVSGDTRFDRVRKIAEKSPALEIIEKFRGNDERLFVAGSTWPKDEEIILRYFKNSTPFMKMIIAPHEVDKTRINKILDSFSHNKTLKFSEATPENIRDKSVLIVDSIGLLSSLYRYGEITYVGGGFGKGIHNILEPATFGLPVIFGPNHSKFREAIDLKRTGGAFSIKDYEDFKGIMNDFRENPQKIKIAGQQSENYVKNNTGSTNIIINRIFE